MDPLRRREAVRRGEWLEVPLASSAFRGGSGGLREDASPHEVRQWLAAGGWLPAKWVNRLFSAGGIRLEADRLLLRAFPEHPLDAHPLAAFAADRSGAGEAPEVLFDDDWCLVLGKPAGMPVHPSRFGHRGTLDEWAVRLCLQAGELVNVRHIHRLDDDTSGPVLYAKRDLSQWVLDEAMREKAIDRRYAALVHGVPKRASGVIDAPIGADRHRPGRRRVAPGGDPALTRYEVAGRYGNASLVRVRLETGRTHQIRVHFSHIGHPLVGDRLYGGSDAALRHQALHGERLVFPHPWLGDTVEVEAPWPAWFREAQGRLAAAGRK